MEKSMTENSIIENRIMHYILKIDQYKSISKAASSLYISQPALSKYLKNVEERLDIKIFNRIGQKMIPTYEGEKFLKYAREICNIEEQLAQELNEMKNGESGRLRFAVPLMRSSYILPQLIPPLISKYPKLKISVHEEHASVLVSLLLNNTVDFAIVNYDIDHSSIVTHLIKKDKFYIAVHPSHPSITEEERKSKTIPKADMTRFKNDSFILQTKGQRTREIADYVFNRYNINPRILFTTRSIQGAMELVSRGCGICFLSETHMKNIKVSNPLFFYSLEGQCPEISLTLAYLDKIYMPSYFIDFVNIAKNLL